MGNPHRAEATETFPWHSSTKPDLENSCQIVPLIVEQKYLRRVASVEDFVVVANAARGQDDRNGYLR